MRLGTKRPVIGPAILSTLVLIGGGKLLTVTPFTEEGRAAWAELGAARAQEEPASADTVVKTDTGPPAGGAQASVDDVASNDEGTPAELLGAIAHERKLLERQRTALEEERAEVMLAREAIETEMARLAELRATVEELLAEARAAHEADIEQLTALYSEMKPADAARIMTGMDLEVTMNVISSMKERDAAPIMAQMPPDRSHAISRIMLERSKLPGDQEPVQVRLR